MLYISNLVSKKNIIDIEYLVLLKIYLEKTRILETNSIIYENMLNIINNYLKFYEKEKISLEKLKEILNIISVDGIIELTEDKENILINNIIKKILNINLNLILLVDIDNINCFITNNNNYENLINFKSSLISKIENINLDINDNDNEYEETEIGAGLWYNNDEKTKNLWVEVLNIKCYNLSYISLSSNNFLISF